MENGFSRSVYQLSPKLRIVSVKEKYYILGWYIWSSPHEWIIRMMPNSADEPVRIPITDVFDLHTIPPSDAKTAVEAYLEEAHKT